MGEFIPPSNGKVVAKPESSGFTPPANAVEVKKKDLTSSNTPLPSPTTSEPTEKKPLLGFGGQLENYPQETPSIKQKDLLNPSANLPADEQVAAEKIIANKKEQEKPQTQLESIKTQLIGTGHDLNSFFNLQKPAIAENLSDEHKIEYGFVNTIENLQKAKSDIEQKLIQSGIQPTDEELSKNPIITGLDKRIADADSKYKIFIIQKNKAIDDEIAQQQEYLKDPDRADWQKRDIEKIISQLQNQKADFFNPDKVYTENKDEIDELKIEGKNAKEKLQNYYLVLDQQARKLRDEIGIGSQIATGIPQGAQDIIGFLSPEMEQHLNELNQQKHKLEDIERQQRQIAPALLINRAYKNSTGGFVESTLKSFTQGLLPNAAGSDLSSTKEQNSQALLTSIAMTGISPNEINPEIIKRTNKDANTPAYSADWWGNLMGQSVSMMPEFAIAGAALKGTKVIGAVRKAFGATKTGKFFANAVETGLEYGFAGELSPTESVGSQEGNVASGTLGGIATQLITGMFGKKAELATGLIKKLLVRGGKAFGETAEELGNDLGQLINTYQQTESWDKVKEQWNQQHGSMSKNLEFFVSTYTMGFFMGGSYIGQQLNAKAKDQYNALDPEEKKQADEFIAQNNKDVKESVVKVVKEEVDKGAEPPLNNPVTPEQVAEVDAAKQVLMNENATPQEKIDATKIVETVESQARETEIAQELGEPKITPEQLAKLEQLKEIVPQETKVEDSLQVPEGVNQNIEYKFPNPEIELNKDNSPDFIADLQIANKTLDNGYGRKGDTLFRIKNHSPDWSNFNSDISEDDSIKKIVNVTIGDFENTDSQRNKEDVETFKKEHPNVEVVDIEIPEGTNIVEANKIIQDAINPKQVQPEQTVTESVTENGQRKKSLLNRGYEGTTTDEIKSAIEKHGLNYNIESHTEASSAAKMFIEDVGADNALKAVRENKIDDGAAAFVWADIIDGVGAELASATDPKEIERLQKLEGDLIDEFDRKARSGGRFISALSEIYQNSDFGYKASTQIQKYKNNNGGEISPEMEAKFKDLETQLNEVKAQLEVARQNEIKSKEQEAINNIQEDIGRKKKSKTSIKEETKRIADKIRQGKINRPSMFLSSSPGAIAWDGAIEIVAKSIETGGKIAEAIEKGLEHIRNTDWYKNLSDDKKSKAEEQLNDFVNHKGKVETGATIVNGNIKIPHALIRSKIEEGITNPDELVKSLHDDLKEQYPDITERQIRDAISGYGKSVNPNRDEVESQINKIKRISRTISKLEDIAKGKRPTISKQAKAKLDAEELALNKELKAALKTLPIEVDIEKGYETAKTRLKNQIENLQDRLKNKDFSKKPKPTPISNSEIVKLQAEKLTIQNEFDKAQYDNELKNRTQSQKVIDGLWEVWNLTRALRATGEFSFMLIQGGVHALSHPINSFKALVNSLSHFASEKRSDTFLKHIQAQEFYPRMKASKLALTEHDAKLNAREELFLGGWVNHVWDALGLPIKVFNKTAYERWKKISPTKAFERAATGYLNTLRIERYLQGEQMLNMNGKTFGANSEDYKAMADVINTFTGRASLGKAEQISKPLSLIFFSPRNWASIIKTTTPYAFWWFGKKHSKGEPWYKPSIAQKMALGDYMKYVALTGAMVMLVKAAEDDDDEKGWKVETDPHSTDFLKPKLGNTRIDPWGGRIQMIVLQARLLNDVILRQGKHVKLGKDAYTPTGGDLLINMAQNKLAPTTAMVAKRLFSHENKEGIRVDRYGQPIGNPLSMTTDNLYPIYWETIKELHKEQPATVAGFIDFFAFMGLGTNTYSDKKPKKATSNLR